MRNLLLSTVSLLVVPAVSFAAPEFITHTHTTPIELKPISQLDKAYKTAGICFLGVGDCAPNTGFDSTPSIGGGSDESFDLDTTSQCLNEGFTKLNCNSVQTIDGVCPYNSSYGRGCKCTSNLISCPAGQVGVGDSCGGKYASCKCDPNLKTCSSKEVGQGASCGGRYESCACKSEYQYTSSNCSYPRSVSGDNCQGKYTNCVCPAGISSTPYGCEEYYPAPCNSVCKIAYADNCRNRDSVSTPYGCAEYWSDCSSKCKTAYNDNCRNRTAVTCQYGCASSFADCQSKCEKCKTDNCDNRTAVISSCPANATCQYYPDCSSKISSWSCNSGYTKSGNSCINPCDNRTNQSCSYGCQTYWSDCSSKCQTCYADNCRNRTAVSTPYGCQTYWSDCSTKCQVAYSDNCRNRTAVSCTYGCQSYFSDCTSKCQTCKTNPDCDVTSKSCSYGCKTTNSCGKCTECKSCTPDFSAVVTIGSCGCLRWEEIDVGCGQTAMSCAVQKSCDGGNSTGGGEVDDDSRWDINDIVPRF